MVHILLNLWKRFATQRMSFVQNGSVRFCLIDQKGILGPRPL